MLDHLRANPDHPFHPYAAALEHANQAQAFASQMRQDLLAGHCGQVVAVEWEMSSAVDEEHLVANITLVLSGHRRLYFGNTTALDHLDNDDWEGVQLQGTDLAEAIHAREGERDISWREATLEILADVLAMPIDQVEGFCWLLEQLVYAQAVAGAGQFYFSPLLSNR